MWCVVAFCFVLCVGSATCAQGSFMCAFCALCWPRIVFTGIFFFLLFSVAQLAANQAHLPNISQPLGVLDDIVVLDRMATANKVKIVAIGDGTVGKTSLLISYSKGEFPDDYVPTVFENYRTQINTSAGPIALDIWDTAGQEEYDEIRKLAFNQVDVFLVCFSIDNPASLQNLESKWIKDVAQSESPKAQVSCAVVFVHFHSSLRSSTSPRGLFSSFNTLYVNIRSSSAALKTISASTMKWWSALLRRAQSP